MKQLVAAIKYKFFKEWYPNWSPDIALRYLPIADDIRNTKGINTILDVGSGSLGITPYLNKQVTGVDTNFSGPYSSSLKQVLSSAIKLPFKNKSFDISICADTLEHIPRNLRKKAIVELIRVTKIKIYIVAPFETISEKEDKILFDYVMRTTGRIDPYIKEHIDYRLPKEKEIIKFFPSTVKIVSKGLTNIYLHRLLLIVQFSNNRIMKFISSVIFVLLVPFFLKINFPPTYRKLFIIDNS